MSNLDRLVDLERLVDRVCREQPGLKAPDTLASRVLGEIARRTALPWWRRSFGHWPLAVRAVFIAACAVIIGAGFSPPMASLAASAAQPLAWAFQAGASLTLVNTVFSHVGADLANSVSPRWLYGAGVGICVLYVLLAGLCATTYRTLYIAR